MPALPAPGEAVPGARTAPAPRRGLRSLLPFASAALVWWSAVAGAELSLEDGFRDPLPAARPHTYWFWLNGHVDAPSAIEELRAMKEAGLGGVLLFDAGTLGGAPVVPPAGPAFLSEARVEQLLQVLQEARSLGLQVVMSVVSSWDMGGPWIEPRHAVMALDTSETTVAGGGRVDVPLPFPPPERAAPLGPAGRPPR